MATSSSHRLSHDLPYRGQAVVLTARPGGLGLNSDVGDLVLGLANKAVADSPEALVATGRDLAKDPGNGFWADRWFPL